MLQTTISTGEKCVVENIWNTGPNGYNLINLLNRNETFTSLSWPFLLRKQICQCKFCPYQHEDSEVKWLDGQAICGKGKRRNAISYKLLGIFWASKWSGPSFPLTKPNSFVMLMDFWFSGTDSHSVPDAPHSYLESCSIFLSLVSVNTVFLWLLSHMKHLSLKQAYI